MSVCVHDEKPCPETQPGDPGATNPEAGGQLVGTAGAVPAVAAPVRDGIRKFTQDQIIAAFGTATSLLTAVILFGAEQTFEVSLYTWTLDFVIPLGAILSGLAAASGYYLGAWYFDYRPTWRILLNMVGVSVGTFFLVHWLRFQFLQADGRPLSEQISFFAYLDWLFRHQTLQHSWGSGGPKMTGELGTWGYLLALLQIGGFALGGLCVFGWLASIPYCDRCARYFSAARTQERFTDDPYAFASTLKRVAAAFDAGRLPEAVVEHTGPQEPRRPKKGRFRSSLDLRRCSRCGKYRLGFSAHEQFGNGWKAIKGAKLAGLQEEKLHLPE